jgi:arylsulfatase A-like enzyme
VAPDPPRVILLLSLDTLRPDHLGFYGYERFTSPVLDEIAREGVVFEDASSTAPWTLPSHASMLTGLYPLRHGVTSSKTRLPDGIPTLAGLLAPYGYDTAAVVNVEWLKKENFRVTGEFAKYLWVPTTLDRKSSNTWVTDQAIEWVEGLGDGRLFLFVHYYDLHSDYTAERAYEKLFVEPYDGHADGTAWQLKRAVLEDDYLEFCHTQFDPDQCMFGTEYVIDENVQKVRFDEDDVQHLKDLYDAQIRQLDTELARLFATLRKRDLFEQTLLIVTSDHGEEFMEHGRVEHFIPTYQETLRIPLVFRGPGVPKGVRVPEPVSNVDIVPTVLELARAPAQSSLDGSTLTGLWSGLDRERFATRTLFGEASGGITYNFFANGFFPVFRSVREGRHKLIYDSKQDRHALYDLEADPAEMTDISSSEPEVAARLVEIMTERYRDFRPEPEAANSAEIDPKDAEMLRALGYVP